MDYSNHRNSKIITIFRSGSFLSRAQGKDVEDYFASSKKSVGSYWESVSSKKVGSGLTFIEEAILLPMLIDVPAEDREFRKKVTDFYVDIDTPVPFNAGRPLEIGLTIDNTKPLSLNLAKPDEANVPLNPTDYIRYRHALNHPLVATTKEEADGNSLIEFYIFDSTETDKKNTKKSDEKDNAFQIFLTIKPDAAKVDMMLTMLGIDPREFTGKDADTKADAKVEALRKKAETEPANFIKVFGNDDMEVHSWIRQMVIVGVLKEMGTKYFDAETNKLIGNTLEETTYYFKDDDNSDIIVGLKARYQEAAKKPIKKKLPTTR